MPAGKPLIIRESVVDDIKPIKELHLNAFDQSEAKLVSQLAMNLLDSKTASAILSLVAEQDNEIIGHVIFSIVNIEGAETVSAYILAPLAVKKSAQRSGIGTQLINKGLDTLKARGAEVVLVYGDPGYYKHTGFNAGHALKPPYKLTYPEESWMAQELVEGILSKTSGTVQCLPPLNSPKLW